MKHQVPQMLELYKSKKISSSKNFIIQLFIYSHSFLFLHLFKIYKKYIYLLTWTAYVQQYGLTDLANAYIFIRFLL